MSRPPSLVAISLGCPAGIGPEVAVTAATELGKRDPRCLLVGDAEVVRRAMKVAGVPGKRLVLVDDVAEARTVKPGRVVVWTGAARGDGLPPPGRPDRSAGATQLAWIDQATDLVARGAADALTTGPASKAAIAGCGAPGAASFRGHTEHLAERLGAREVVMAFWSEALTVALVTTHLPLSAVPAAIDAAGVERTTFWLATLVHDLGRRAPRLVVAALNPHAGESGLLGDEEQTAITPGIERARDRLARARIEARVEGPIGAETAFRLAVRRGDRRPRWDAVVAMYHDQATIPSKLLGFGDAVNVSLGLPIVRTSVDHGTGYDVAGKGLADASGMVAAVRIAGRLARARGRS